MAGLAAPGWLPALAVLLLPVALHLWSRRPTRVVRLGSLRHLDGAPGPRAWGRRLDDLPLLALRMGLLAAVVVALAGPRWPRADSGGGDGVAVVVVDPELLADSLALFSDPVIDSLRRAGAPLRPLAVGLPLWTALGEVDRTLPPGSSLLVVAAPRAGRLGAERPALRSVVRWHQPAPRQTPAPGSPAPAPARTLLVIGPTAGFEARALRAAFEAASGRLDGRLPVVRLAEAWPTGDTARTDWIAWLPDAAPAPGALQRVTRGARLLALPRRSAPEPVDRRVAATAGAAAPDALRATRLMLRAGTVSGIPLLSDDAGDPFLTVERAGSGVIYRLGTRLDPAWSDLAAGGALPELMAFLLREGNDPSAAAPVSLAQALPRAAGPGGGPAPEPIRLAPFGFLAAALLFLLERHAAHRRRRHPR